MTHRTVIRLFSGALLAALVLGCGDDEPTAPGGPFLTVTPEFSGLDQGTTLQLSATVDGQAVPVTWESSNTAKATVSATGLVTGVDSGRVAITATATSDPSLRQSSSISVVRLQGIQLTSGVAVAGLASSGARGSGVLYRIFVPAGSTLLNVTLRGGTGDADIYVQRATPPTNAGANATGCNSFNGGNDEDAAPRSSGRETWYILIDLWDPTPVRRYGDCQLSAI